MKYITTLLLTCVLSCPAIANSSGENNSGHLSRQDVTNINSNRNRINNSNRNKNVNRNKNFNLNLNKNQNSNKQRQRQGQEQGQNQNLSNNIDIALGDGLGFGWGAYPYDIWAPIYQATPWNPPLAPIQPQANFEQARPRAETHLAAPSFIHNGVRFVVME